MSLKEPFSKKLHDALLISFLDVVKENEVDETIDTMDIITGLTVFSANVIRKIAKVESEKSNIDLNTSLESLIRTFTIGIDRIKFREK